MIKNATLTNITPRPTSSPSGSLSYGAGTTFSPGIRILFDQVRRAQVIALAAKIGDASGVVFLEKPDLPSGQTVNEGTRLVIAVDGISGPQAARIYEVNFVIDSQKDGGLSHFEAFVKLV